MRVKLLLGVITVIFMSQIISCTSTSNEQTTSSTPSSSPANTPITISSPAAISPPSSPSEVSLQSISISPAKPEPLSIGSVQDFKANGKYSDGSIKDISSQVTWASSDPSVASMYPYGGAFANSHGTTQITATLNGIVSQPVVLTIPPNDNSVLIYLDANYSKLWDSTNQPDLSTIEWKPDTSQSGSPYSWEQGILVVYLWNNGNKTLKVNAEDNLNAVSPGFGVSSDTVTIPPNGRAPLNIKVERSPDVLRFSGNGSFSVWFNIR